MSDIEVTITLPDGKLATCRVVYLQPSSMPWLQSSLDLDIHYSEPLKIGVYEAVLTDGSESTCGQYYIHDYEEALDAQGWLFFGIFSHGPTGQE